MDLDEYQDRALETAIYPRSPEGIGLLYTALKLNGEAGEVADKIGKAVRDDALMSGMGGELIAERRYALAKELGDVLWYVAALANELGYSLESVAALNLAKLGARRVAGTLQGEGDDR